MNLIQKLFGKTPAVDFKTLQKNAAIIDVRTKDEFRTGHIKSSINIPLQSLGSRIDEIRKLNKPVITCCASGVRSGMAKKVLEKAGLEVYNGGGWNGLEAKLR